MRITKWIREPDCSSMLQPQHFVFVTLLTMGLLTGCFDEKDKAANTVQPSLLTMTVSPATV